MKLFWWMIPVLFWNMTFTQVLPAGLDDLSALPVWLTSADHALRIFVLVVPYWLHEQLPVDRRARWLTAVGIVVYFLSWLPVLTLDGAEQQLVWVVLPALSPLLWMSGMTWMSRNPLYGVMAVGFVCLHTFTTVQTLPS